MLSDAPATIVTNLRHSLRYCFSMEVLLALVVFSVPVFLLLMILASIGGLFRLILALFVIYPLVLIVHGFIKHCLLIINSGMQGPEYPHFKFMRLSVLPYFIVGFAVIWSIDFVGGYFPPFYVVGCGLLYFVPASICAYLITERVEMAFNPKFLFDMIRHLGWDYPVCFLLAAGTYFFLNAAVSGWTDITPTAVVATFWLAMLWSRYTGLMVYARSQELEEEVPASPIPIVVDTEDNEPPAFNLLDLAYRLHLLCRAGKVNEAVAVLDAELATQRYEHEAEVNRYLLDNGDPRLARRHSEYYIARLAARRKYQVVWRCFLDCIRATGFVPRMDEELFWKLVDLACEREQYHVAAKILADYERYFPDSGRGEAAARRALDLYQRHLDDEPLYARIRTRLQGIGAP